MVVVVVVEVVVVVGRGPDNHIGPETRQPQSRRLRGGGGRSGEGAVGPEVLAGDGFALIDPGCPPVAVAPLDHREPEGDLVSAAGGGAMVPAASLRVPKGSGHPRF